MRGEWRRVDPVWDHDALVPMVRELLGALRHARRRHDDARRAVEHAPEERAIQQPVLPLGAHDLAVEVDDERPALPGEEVGHERDRVRLVHDRQVGTERAGSSNGSAGDSPTLPIIARLPARVTGTPFRTS